MNYKSIIITTAIVLLMCGTASAWYGDYENRRAITIDNSNITELDYYSVNVDLTGTPINETSLIIVNESASQVVPHFCTNISGGNCYSLRFNCTHLPNDGILSDTYYIYYTNASASSTSNGTTTFVKYDSFEGTNIDSSFWDVLIDGVVTSSDQSATGSKSAKFVLTTDTISGSLTHSDNIAIEYSLYTTTTGDYFMGRHGDGSKALNTYAYGADIKYYTTSWHDTGGNMFNNAWGVIGWSDFNWSANTHDILYDNTVIAENVGFRTSYTQTDDEFLISTTSKTAYVDDFIVRKHYTTPSQASDWEVPGGYTCTGLSYDSTENCLWNADFDNGTIVKIAKNGTKLGEINNININGIQGVAYDSSDNTLWASSYYDGKTCHIYKNGTYVGDNISIGRNGCSYEAATDSLWIMQEFNISRVDASTGIIQENITIAAGGDGLAYDASDDTLWYSKDATTDTIRHIYASNGTEIGFFSSPATCPEGLTVDSSDGTIWHADDSEYHASVPNGNRIYHLTKTGVAKSGGGYEPQTSLGAEEGIPSYTNIVLGANKYGMLRKNVSSSETFSTIAAGFDHDVCFTWWNSTGDVWESYWVGDSYNSAVSVPQNNSYFVLMDGTGETILCSIAPAGTVAIPIGWSTTYLRESTNKTLTAIKSDMGGNCTDLYAWNHTAAGTGSWTDAGAYSVLPNQGLLVNASTGFNWDGAVP